MIKLEIYYEQQGQNHKHVFCLGQPKPGNHPLTNQASWITKTKGGIIPQEVMESISSLKRFSEDNQLDFEEVCKAAYSVGELKGILNEKQIGELRSIKVFGRFLN